MSGIAIFVFVLFCLCNTIILLNLLIALMADSFDRVQENALAQGRYEQALSIRQIEAMLAPAVLQDARFFPRCVPPVLRGRADRPTCFYYCHDRPHELIAFQRNTLALPLGTCKSSGPRRWARPWRWARGSGGTSGRAGCSGST